MLADFLFSSLSLSVLCVLWFPRESLRRVFAPMMSWMWLNSILLDTWTCSPASRTSSQGKISNLWLLTPTCILSVASVSHKCFPCWQDTGLKSLFDKSLLQKKTFIHANNNPLKWFIIIIIMTLIKLPEFYDEESFISPSKSFSLFSNQHFNRNVFSSLLTVWGHSLRTLSLTYALLAGWIR